MDPCLSLAVSLGSGAVFADPFIALMQPLGARRQ